MIHGRVVNVTEEAAGDELAADALDGATVIYVDDLADFSDEDEGGWLLIAGVVYEYLSTDEDTGAITLATGIIGDDASVPLKQVAGTRVDVWDPDAGAVVVEYVADVVEDGLPGGDLQATVDHALADRIGRTPAALVGESVVIERDRFGRPQVANVLGKAPQLDGGFVRDPLLVGSLDSPSSTKSWPDNAWTLVPWKVLESEDIVYDTATEEFVIQSDGIYDFRCGISFEGNPNGARGVRPHFKYIDPVMAEEDGRPVRLPAQGITGIETSQLKRFAAGDRLSFYAYQSSGAALDVFRSNTDVSILRRAS